MIELAVRFPYTTAHVVPGSAASVAPTIDSTGVMPLPATIAA